MCFDPREKTFMFRMDEYDCYRIKSHKCPIDTLTIEEILNMNLSISLSANESDPNYCIGIAQLILNNKMKSPAIIQHCLGCGHYTFSDGQHRTCVASKLLNKSIIVYLNYDVTMQSGSCKCCLMDTNLRMRKNFIESLSPFKRLILKKEYDKVINEWKNPNCDCFLIKL